MSKRKQQDIDRKANAKNSKCIENSVEESISIIHKDKTIACILTLPSTTHHNIRFAMILTHGAGGDMHSRQLKYLADRLSANGHPVLRFTCKGLNIIYRTSVYLSVLKHFRSVRDKYGFKKCVLGGRSMGSRAAVNVANLVQEDTELREFTAGVCCLAYPLHPAKQTNKLRDEPLFKLNTPVLFISGTKDDMAEQDLLKTVLKKIPGEKNIHWLEGINHSHTTTKNREAMLEEEVIEAVTKWMLKL